MRFNTLRWQFILAFLAVIGTTLSIISLSLLFLLENNTAENRLTLLELNGRALGLGVVLRRNAPENPIRLLKELAAQENLRLAWADLREQIVFDTQEEWQGRTLSSLNLQAVRVTERRTGELKEKEMNWLLVAVPWPNVQTPRGYLIAATPPPAIPVWRRFRNTVALPLTQAGTVTFLLALLLAVWLSRSIARPLQQVATAAHQLAGGELTARAPLTGPEEVRELAQSFNEMARQVQKSQQSQRDLVANIAHDLRTPLTAIQGFAQALVDGTAGESPTREQAAGAIYEESLRMRRMIDTLLELARFDAGQVQLQLQPLDLVQLTRHRLDHFQPRARETGITLKIEATAPVTLSGDAARLEQVLDNLLDNALRHTPAGGKITVTVRSAPPFGEITVTDNGPGIPAADLERIFERFYRAEKSRGGQGMGLGLAIVREIVQSHGGSIHAESVVDLGTRFIIQLPLA